MVCFHGNAGNIGYRLPNAYYMFRELHSNIVMVDYRGYGNSEGIPTERGLSYDAESVLAHLLERNDINLSKIYIFGRSLGMQSVFNLFLNPIFRWCFPMGF